MAEATQVIATFNTGTEAQVAQVRLQAEGIQAFVSADVPNPASFSLLGRFQFAPVQLSVGISDAARAQEILSQPANETELENDWQDAAESAVSGWLCLGCDTEVPIEQEACPECGTLRSEQPLEDEEEDED